MADLPRNELIRAFVSLAVTLVVMAALLFGAAGTLGWAHGWWFMLTFVVLTLAAIAWLWRVNPEIFVARARPTGQGTKGWDLVILPIALTGFAAILPVAGLDDGRFHWAPAPDWAIAIGYVLLVAAMPARAGRKPSTGTSSQAYGFRRNGSIASSATVPTATSAIPATSLAAASGSARRWRSAPGGHCCRR